MSKSSKKKPGRPELYAAIALVLPMGGAMATVPAGTQAPVVDIAAPNSAGVSHNQFAQFDVGTQGKVLNNSQNGAHTELAGTIAGNANLTNGAASVIIAEVTGSAASQLNGALEIGGQKAALIVANPNGINANGASFINASRVTLTTGTPQLNAQGQVASIDVAKGVINVAGTGIDARGVEMADLMARSIALNAQLQAKQLRVVTGHNRVSYGSNGNSIVTTDIAGTGTAPTVALDVGSMGSMYANAIRMQGTETGVGVNIAGKVKAIDSVNLTSGGNMHVLEGGKVMSDHDIHLAVATSLTNDGIIAAKRDIHAEGQSFLSTGNAWFAAGRNVNRRFSSSSDEGNNGVRPDDVPGRNSWVEPPAEQPPVQQPPAEQPPVQQPPVEQPPVQQPPAEQPPVQQPPVEQPPVQQPPAEQPPVQQPPAEQPPVQQPPAEQPPVQQPPAEQPPVQQPPVEQPPVQQPPAEQPPVQQPPVQQPPAEQPPVQQPPANKPPIQQPPVEQPPAHKPVAQQPTIEQIILGQLLDMLYGRPSYGYAPWAFPAIGFAPWSQPSYGYSPWMPQVFRPRPVFSPWRPMAYGYGRPHWR
ncbi:filamentous hemagglutinin N-terminal domain-containing protein [Dyella sp. SG609]|uniref:filamentous hemagglutinin N-terminal domain-containing protein n=1 Tax=Dyella sp. SG609 TaxID=2587018 RepID=UPI00144806DB|nr:filamentous hemagglutinin N-terminal domain-containing protein [Dyella sp. SG609]NKJ21123.1 filamentous hemagglutinin family protein [Dyella sp. SG609]